jgi:hypothetical protein
MIVFLIWLGIAACAGHPQSHAIDPVAGQSSLDFWLEESLIPYLLQQLVQHPRFKGQPVLLVHMQGENILPRIDDLTKQIRHKIHDALLKKSGLNLAWRPAIQPWQHHQSLEDITCDDYNTVRYYIGIDTGLSQVQRKLYVKVRALNLSENKWVSGFGKSWTGTPSRDQLDALAREHPADYLRGLRPLPFSDRQPDMLAAYLARNLSCLLRQGETDDLVVHVAPPAPNTPAMIKTALDLVGKYLTRFREVEVTDDPNQANVTVASAVHSIDQDLHQVWISARQRQGDIYLPGAEAEAYVMMKSRKEPHIAGLNQVKPSGPRAPFQNIAMESGIIGSFDLLAPLNHKFCATEKPWRSGIQHIDPHESLLTGSCVAVEMKVTTPAYVFLVGQDATGELTRLLPSNCPALTNRVARLQPGELFQFPSLSDPQAGVLELDGTPGTERIYAIAVTTPELADRFADRIAAFRSLCRPGRKFPDRLPANRLPHPQDRIQRWQNYLKQLAMANSGQLEWREFSFRHVES